MIPQSLTGLRNKTYTPGRKLGQGGEGAVFDVAGEAGMVMKLYTEAPDADKKAKLLHMASLQHPDLAQYAAWPQDVLQDRFGIVKGFVMRRLDAYVPLHNLFNPMDRKKLFPDKGYNFLVHVARNVAIAFYKMHQLGIVIGDVNEANILVNPAGMVSLIDCDSFQVKDGDRYYFCEVGIPRYTPPELLEQGTFSRVVRTEDTDHFSLATLLFQLLFLGRVPFTGINPATTELDEETAIRTREFAYSLRNRVKKLMPAKNSLLLSALSPKLVDYFHAAFEDKGVRPAASQWITELGAFGSELMHCSMARIHYYPRHMKECPWCAFREQANVLYFLDDAYLKGMPDMSNIQQFINGFKLQPLQYKTLSLPQMHPGIQVGTIARKYRLLRHVDFLVIALIIAATMLFCTAYHNWGYMVFAPLIAIVYKLVSPAKSIMNEELHRLERDYYALEVSMQAVVEQHNNLPVQKKYNPAAARMNTLIAGFRALPQAYAEKKKAVEERHYNRKYTLYLEQFDIVDHPIPGFGEAKKQLLMSHGIRNAGDIFKLKSQKIPGIGPKNLQLLYDWQRQMGSGFSYVPNMHQINLEIGTAHVDVTNQRKKLETDLRAEYEKLMKLKALIEPRAKALREQYDSISIPYLQAKADVTAFRKVIIW